jgi:pimeloyl-ACP methyl ester carboxylesterase
MAIDTFNNVRLRYELSSDGDVPLVLVHGSWGSHQQWVSVASSLSQSFRVLSYDRRGHSESERPTGQGSVREDVADLIALIETLGLAPAWVAGNSFGSAITLRLAVERPDLVRGIVCHEPPLFSLLADDPAAVQALKDVGPLMGSVIQRLASGDHAAAAEQFFTDLALAPGEWQQMPPEYRDTVVENAPTFLDEAQDPEALQFDLEWVRDFASPTLLTMGEQSPPQYAPVLEKLAEALPRAERLTFPNAGHLPHVTHPDAYVEATTAFVRKHEE